MSAVATLKRHFDETITPRPHHLWIASLDDVDAMIASYEYEQRQANRRKMARVVRFREQDNQEHDVALHCDTWLSKEECRQIRDEAIQDVRAVASSALQPKTLLDENIFATTEESEKGYPKQGQTNETTSERMLGDLTQWTRQVGPGRGLENQINKKLGKARKRHRVRAVRAVLIGQKIAREGNHGVETGKLLDLVSQKYSTLSKKHALLMGKADERAARDVHCN